MLDCPRKLVGVSCRTMVAFFVGGSWSHTFEMSGSHFRPTHVGVRYRRITIEKAAGVLVSDKKTLKSAN